MADQPIPTNLAFRADMNLILSIKAPLDHLLLNLMHSRLPETPNLGVPGLTGGPAPIAVPIPMEPAEKTKVRVAVALGLAPVTGLWDPDHGTLDVDSLALGIRERLGFGSAEAALTELESYRSFHKELTGIHRDAATAGSAPLVGVSVEETPEPSAGSPAPPPAVPSGSVPDVPVKEAEAGEKPDIPVKAGELA